MKRNIVSAVFAASSLLSLSLPGLLSAAEPLQVVVDIAPVNSLVKMVLGDRGRTKMLLAPGADPHHSSLRPSDAKSLSNADVIFSVGPNLTPQLSEKFLTLAPDALIITFDEEDAGWQVPFRSLKSFSSDQSHDVAHKEDEHKEDEHKEDEHHEDEHHEDEHHADEHHEDEHHEDEHHEDEHHEDEHHEDEHHADEHHEDEHHEDEHKEDEHHDDEDHHDHAGQDDPHGWLSPKVATLWIDTIVAALSRADNENASFYETNGVQAKQSLADLHSALSEKLMGHKDKKFLLEHDTLQYFEALYSLTATGTFIAGDGQAHGAGTAVRAKKFIAENGPICLFIQEGLPSERLKAILDGSDVIYQPIDVLGVRQQAESEDLYSEMMLTLGTDISTCLAKTN